MFPFQISNPDNNAVFQVTIMDVLSIEKVDALPQKKGIFWACGCLKYISESPPVLDRRCQTVAIFHEGMDMLSNFVPGTYFFDIGGAFSPPPNCPFKKPAISSIA
jgi:hypothetical protein